MARSPNSSILFFMIARLLIIGLSLAGLAISLYFTFAYYGRVRKSRWVPEILCAREGSSCVTVVQTPYARVIGVPNSLLGIVYYPVMMGWILVAPHGEIWNRGVILPLSTFNWVLAALSAIPVGLGCYLVYTLRWILRIDCPLCYAAHAINLALFVLLVVAM
jgi:uncharacterized membrane protein